MNCAAFREHLDDFARGRTAEYISKAMRTHLESCPACRTEFADHSALLSLLDRQSEIKIEPGELAGFLPGVWNKIERGKGYRAWSYRLLPAAALAVVLLAFVFRQIPDRGISPEAGGTVENLESLEAYSSLIAAMFGDEIVQEIEIVEQELESQGLFFVGGYEDMMMSMGDEDLKKLESKLEELRGNKG